MTILATRDRLMRKKLTAKMVMVLTCSPDRERDCCWDTALTGFGVVTYRTGRRTYVVRFREGGHTRRRSIGDVATMEFSEARKQAKSLLAEARRKERKRRRFEDRTRGRPRLKKGAGALVSLRLDKRLLTKLDDWIDRRRGMSGPSRSAAIRMCIQYCLQLEGFRFPSGRRVTLAVEDDDSLKRVMPSTSRRDISQRADAVDQSAAAKIADKYISRNGIAVKFGLRAPRV
jgi:hypothetical protein